MTESATPPLAIDDVLLSVANVATAGLPLEQVDQLGFASSDAKTPLSAIVLRGGKIVQLEVGQVEDAEPPVRAAGDLPFERVAFGEGDALIVSVKDVRDDLGDDLAGLIADERDRGPRKLSGVVLDLRGNGGGSTDGALSALSLFLPGAPLFAMRRRDGTVEIDRAPVPRDRDRWTGPVATFVDGTTASAAEMIAGALATYKRGPSVGATTFGKGCAQEYVDDDAHAGVLRLTTLVYALPDGTPVQRIGLAPQVRFPFTPQGEPGAAQEREAKLAHTAPPWRGPDVRDSVGAQRARRHVMAGARRKRRPLSRSRDVQGAPPPRRIRSARQSRSTDDRESGVQPMTSRHAPLNPGTPFITNEYLKAVWKDWKTAPSEAELMAEAKAACEEVRVGSGQRLTLVRIGGYAWKTKGDVLLNWKTKETTSTIEVHRCTGNGYDWWVQTNKAVCPGGYPNGPNNFYIAK